MKVLYLSIQRAGKKWTMPIPNWGPALARFAIEFGERTPNLNRIKSIHASLAIENNTLSLEQFTALHEGKRVPCCLIEEDTQKILIQFRIAPVAS